MAIHTSYEVLSQSFNFATEDQRQWWHHTAPVFVKSMTDAQYSRDAQYKQLTFFYHCVLPHLGQFPVKINSGKPSKQRYKSNLSPYGLPFEFSLNFPELTVRYSYEPIGPEAGTMADPFNVDKMGPVIGDLAHFTPSIDTTLFRKLADLLLLSREEAKKLISQPGFTPGGPARGQYQFAVDMKGERPMLKGYFFTTMKSLATGISADRLIANAIRAVDQAGKLAAPLAEMESYTQSRAASTFITGYLGCDMIDPARARLKVYASDSEVTFERLIDLWTLGGRIPNEATTTGRQGKGLEALRELWDLLQIPPGIREMKVEHMELGDPPKSLLPVIVNYTLLPNKPYPEPQVYLVPFGLPDMQIAEALTQFFVRMGWEEAAKTYKENLFSY
ncbi:hypothetical protein ASPCAL13995 [Aspergillus calidoustus]|uniref:Dimethylallyl tryptophan synthase n=1 Tax=Aspergillus calidoustus TaxID=454130 RepID=A0A0U5GJ05_ASPCI|nr:hypothetical protein ASPCAL13995 [Aspergillus calidoustus]